jgi:predicted nucleotidyltransferase
VTASRGERGPRSTVGVDGLDRSVDALLERLVAGVRDALGDDVVAIYLFGSAVTGAFEPGISDVDTAVVLRSEPDDAQVERLERMHDRLVAGTPEWRDRVEVVYVPVRALLAFRDEPAPGARISRGEPFHAIELDTSWVIDWYRVGGAGVALVGPPPAELVPAISTEEYVEAVRRHLLGWPDSTDALATSESQAYAVLTMCRGLRTVRTGDDVSKREAAAWAAEVLPHRAALIDAALGWRAVARTDRAADPRVSREDVRSFVEEVAALVG